MSSSAAYSSDSSEYDGYSYGYDSYDESERSGYSCSSDDICVDAENELLGSLVAEWRDEAGDDIEEVLPQVALLNYGYSAVKHDYYDKNYHKIAHQISLANHGDNSRIFLGPRGVADSEDKMAALGVTHVLSVADTYSPAFPEKYTYKVVSVTDDAVTNLKAHFSEAISFIETALSEGSGIYVHCEMGISRSATVLAAYLIHKHKLSVDDALELLKSNRGCVNPNPGFVGQLHSFAGSKPHRSHKHHRPSDFNVWMMGGMPPSSFYGTPPYGWRSGSYGSRAAYRPVYF